MSDLYISPDYAIGKHRWRCVVYRHPTYGPCTHWEWRRFQADPWRHHREWPRYDFNNTHYGLPRTLGHVYEAHKPEIFAALGKPLAPPSQATLF